MTKPIPKELQKKRGPKGKADANVETKKPAVLPVEPNVSGGGASNNPPLKSLVERVLQERAGSPEQAREPRAKAETKKPEAKAAPKKADPVDMEMVDALAGALADGEGAIASFAVPAAQADQVQSKVSRMLKFAWKYHFIQNGITGFPSWAVLLVAHMGMGVMMLKPNMERMQTAWDEFTGKVEKKKPEGKVVDHKPKAPEANVRREPVEEHKLQPLGDPETGRI